MAENKRDFIYRIIKGIKDKSHRIMDVIFIELQKKVVISRWILALFIIVFLFLGIIGNLLINRNDNSNYDELVRVFRYEDFDLLIKGFKYLRNNYVDKISDNNLIHGAIKGMIGSLGDAHTRFMEEEEWDDMKINTSGRFGGLGIVITIRNDILTIISPIEDTPAYRIGLKPNDKIISIDDESTSGIKLFDAVKKLRGRPGTKVTIGVMRTGFMKPKNYTITRDIIRIKSVKWAIMKENGYGYIRLKSFQQDTALQLGIVVKNMIQEKIPGIVIDLRMNPGGLLNSAIDIADFFIDKGVIVSTKGRIPEQNQTFYASPDFTISSTIPIAVLVDNGSASASEIVSGCLKDHHRAVLIGNQTFGKGSVQTVKYLGKNTGLAITTAKYYTPSGICIHGKGITPDIIIPKPDYSLKEQLMYLNLVNEKYIDKFIAKHRDYNQKDLDKFMKFLNARNIMLSRQLIKRLIDNQIIFTSGETNIYNIRYDDALQRAVEILSKSR